jgi:citrate synthase
VTRQRKEIRTDIGWSDSTSITLFGRDFPSEILGKLNLGDMGFLELTGRFPAERESKMFNAMVVALVEHGITPSALVARLTYLGAPESLQGAVAAGLSGLGTVFVGSIEGAAKALREAMPQPDAGADFTTLARKVVETHQQEKRGCCNWHARLASTGRTSS